MEIKMETNSSEDNEIISKPKKIIRQKFNDDEYKPTKTEK